MKNSSEMKLSYTVSFSTIFAMETDKTEPQRREELKNNVLRTLKCAVAETSPAGCLLGRMITNALQHLGWGHREED